MVTTAPINLVLLARLDKLISCLNKIMFIRTRSLSNAIR